MSDEEEDTYMSSFHDEAPASKDMISECLKLLEARNYGQQERFHRMDHNEREDDANAKLSARYIHT